jgi:uncharacterized protein YjbJ (UPF0337 family)
MARAAIVPGAAASMGQAGAPPCAIRPTFGRGTLADKRAFCRRHMLRKEPAMNWDQIKGNWKQLQGSARQKWGKLTDDDLERAKGDRDQMVGIVQERYGIAKDEAEREVDEWQRAA